MKREQSLKRDAIAACNFRGHTMSRFKTIKRGVLYRSLCTVCGMYVDVEPNPMPNGIDIGGTAVALHCGDKE